jgi:hypothetical protein
MLDPNFVFIDWIPDFSEKQFLPIEQTHIKLISIYQMTILYNEMYF